MSNWFSIICRTEVNKSEVISPLKERRIPDSSMDWYMEKMWSSCILLVVVNGILYSDFLCAKIFGKFK